MSVPLSWVVAESDLSPPFLLREAITATVAANLRGQLLVKAGMGVTKKTMARAV